MLTRILGLSLVAMLPGWEAVATPAVTAAIPDPVLRGLVNRALEKRPELAGAQANLKAEAERSGQESALPDPTLALSIQNDGFRKIQIGEMESSYMGIMASQTFPWMGKRRLRGEVADLGRQAAEADWRRLLLSITAEVERAYVDLLLARERLSLLGKLESLWVQSEVLSRVRYETGEGPQSDLLRAQLQIMRLKQERWALLAEEKQILAVLSRLTGDSLEVSFVTPVKLSDLPDPTLAPQSLVQREAETESPELALAQLELIQAEKRSRLAEKDRYPDITVSAGIMPRGGDFETMWQAGVALNVPIWARQRKSVAEKRLRTGAAQHTVEATRQLLFQRIAERQAILAGLLESISLFRSGLLVQSEATVESTLAQYQVGKVTFASVLEALGGYVADRTVFLQSLVAAQRLAIAERELSLEAPTGSSAGSMGASAMPGSGATPAAPATRRTGSGDAGETTGGSMSRM